MTTVCRNCGCSDLLKRKRLTGAKSPVFLLPEKSKKREEICQESFHKPLDKRALLWYNHIVPYRNANIHKTSTPHTLGNCILCWCGSMAEQLICNQQVVGSTPITSSIQYAGCVLYYLGEFPSGQRGQTVNLLAPPSVVRIHLPPFKTKTGSVGSGFLFSLELYGKSTVTE